MQLIMPLKKSFHNINDLTINLESTDQFQNSFSRINSLCEKLSTLVLHGFYLLELLFNNILTVIINFGNASVIHLKTHQHGVTQAAQKVFWFALCKPIQIQKSGKFLYLESRIREISAWRIRNPGLWNRNTTNDWIPESMGAFLYLTPSSD